jgi:hypothetical protein
MRFFMFAGIEIQIKMSKQFMSLIIFYLENSNVWVPDLYILQLFEV